MQYRSTDYVDLSEQMIREINEGHFDNSAVNSNVHVSVVN